MGKMLNKQFKDFLNYLKTNNDGYLEYHTDNLHITFDRDNSPITLDIAIDDATPHESFANILQTAIKHFTGTDAERIMQFDDYDEILHTIDTQYGYGEQINDHIPVTYTLNIGYELIN